jgi:hypothetical protein
VPPSFRPRLETLESRDVPSATPFRVAEVEPNGTYDTSQQLPDLPAVRILGRTASARKTTVVDLDGYQFTTVEPNETVVLGPRFATGPVKPLPGGAFQFTDWLDVRVYDTVGNLMLYRRFFQGGDYSHAIRLRLAEAGKYSVVVGCGDCFGADVRAAFRYSLDVRRPALGRDLRVASAAWDPANGGVRFAYDVSNFRLPPGQSVELAVRWATGPTLDQAIGPPVLFTFTPVGQVGRHRVNVAGSALRDGPEGATYLLVIVDPEDKVHERNEGNNVRVIDFSLIPDA